SLMTEAVKGKRIGDAEEMFEAFRTMLAGGANAPGKLAAFSGVGAFPRGIKCANLAWDALRAPPRGSAAPVTTESGRDLWCSPPRRGAGPMSAAVRPWS